jgi:hypothetical protein
MIHDDEIDQRRIEIAQHRRELDTAIVKLRTATHRPLGLADGIRDHPLPWLAGGLLIGLWLGSRRH